MFIATSELRDKVKNPFYTIVNEDKKKRCPTYFFIQVLQKCSHEILIKYVLHVKLLQWFSLGSFLCNVTENLLIIFYRKGFIFIDWCD